MSEAVGPVGSAVYRLGKKRSARTDEPRGQTDRRGLIQRGTL